MDFGYGLMADLKDQNPYQFDLIHIGFLPIFPEKSPSPTPIPHPFTDVYPLILSKLPLITIPNRRKGPIHPLVCL
jgi:hypothetical protein